MSNTVSNGEGDEKPQLLVDGNVTQVDIQAPSSYGQQHYGQEPSFLLNEFQFDSEMGPVADITTFPPTMAPYPPEDNMGVLAVDNILSSGFWDNMLVPGTSSDQLYVFSFVMPTFLFVSRVQQHGLLQRWFRFRSKWQWPDHTSLWWFAFTVRRQYSWSIWPSSFYYHSDWYQYCL